MANSLTKFMAKAGSGEDITFYRNQEGINYSVYPPQTFLTFEYWIFMVPQYKPKSVLMLGYGAGTVAGLIRLIWGKDVSITAVDTVPPEDPDRYGVDFIQADAREFVKDCGSFDTVIVDLFDNEKARNAEFVTDPDFVESLERIGNYLIINGMDLDMSAYEHFKLMGINKSQAEVLIYYYETRNKIPYLHPHK